MGKSGSGILRGFSLKQLLILSIAINIGLISKFVLESEKQSSHGDSQSLSGKQQKKQGSAATLMAADGVHVSKRSIRADIKDDGESVINLDHGDPTMYETYWKTMGDKTSIMISGWDSLSYFSDVNNLCWFLEPDFGKQIRRLHRIVGNAVTENKYIVVGTGSTQLYQAALYALVQTDSSEPMNVVSAVPYYSSYPLMTDFLKSGLYKWGGDANSYDKEGPFIELVTSPNNPDGFTRQPVVNRSQGIYIHDFAYYWPQYTPITYAADHDLMLFTVSKSTGHAGMRIGWALVKDEKVAKKMVKFIELNTIGVSKDSQLRAAKVLEAVSDSCENEDNAKKGKNFFVFGYEAMTTRWIQLRNAVKQSELFLLPEFPSAHCNFLSLEFAPQPAFAWLKCKRDIEDCERFLREHKILTRGGKHFGVSTKFVRISMLDRDDNYDRFITRLSMMN